MSRHQVTLMAADIAAGFVTGADLVPLIAAGRIFYFMYLYKM